MAACDGCRYQVARGQRRPENVRQADPRYACGNCRRPLCRAHATWNGAVAEYLCARCEVIWQRKHERRVPPAGQLPEDSPDGPDAEVEMTLEAAERAAGRDDKGGKA